MILQDKLKLSKEISELMDDLQKNDRPIAGGNEAGKE